MKKIIVIGCPGSGKSTFSKKLNKLLSIPIYHLDMMYWNEDKTTVEKNIFLGHLAEALAGYEWIIDGNYLSTMERRMAACDTVIFLDYSLEVCLNGVRERRGMIRSDMPWIETEEDGEFVDFIKGFEENVKPGIMELLNKYKDKNIIVFKDREESERFLENYICEDK